MFWLEGTVVVIASPPPIMPPPAIETPGAVDPKRPPPPNAFAEALLPKSDVPVVRPVVPAPVLKLKGLVAAVLPKIPPEETYKMNSRSTEMV
jgi:hypothetical protein